MHVVAWAVIVGLLTRLASKEASTLARGPRKTKNRRDGSYVPSRLAEDRMSNFTQNEIEYLKSGLLGRLATVGPEERRTRAGRDDLLQR